MVLMYPPLEAGVRGEAAAYRRSVSIWTPSAPSTAGSARWAAWRVACVDIAASWPLACGRAAHSTPVGWQHAAAAALWCDDHGPAAGAASRRGVGLGAGRSAAFLPAPRGARRDSSRIARCGDAGVVVTEPTRGDSAWSDPRRLGMDLLFDSSVRPSGYRSP